MEEAIENACDNLAEEDTVDVGVNDSLDGPVHRSRSGRITKRHNYSSMSKGDI